MGHMHSYAERRNEVLEFFDTLAAFYLQVEKPLFF